VCVGCRVRGSKCTTAMTGMLQPARITGQTQLRVCLCIVFSVLWFVLVRYRQGELQGGCNSRCAFAVCCSVLHCVVTSDNYTAATPGMRACAPVCVHACMCVGVRARERVFVRVCVFVCVCVCVCARARVCTLFDRRAMLECKGTCHVTYTNESCCMYE